MVLNGLKMVLIFFFLASNVPDDGWSVHSKNWTFQKLHTHYFHKLLDIKLSLYQSLGENICNLLIHGDAMSFTDPFRTLSPMN
jgi:hypothetical protein